MWRRSQSRIRPGLVSLLVSAAIACHTGHVFADSARDLHVLLVIDTQAKKRGADLKDGVEANLEQLKTVIDEVYREQYKLLNGRLYVNILRDDDVSPDKIRQAYKTTTATEASSIFFYYCGHGAFDKKKGHYLATSGGDITRAEIRNILNGTRARSIVMITDCCSSYAEFEPPKRRVPAKWKVFRQLFYENEGIVDFTAATEKEFGWFSAKGGLFTRSLVKYLCEGPEGIRADGQDGPVTWDDFFSRVKQSTTDTFDKAKANAANDAQIKDSEAQTPFAWRLGGWHQQYTRQLVLANNTNERVGVWLRFYDRDFETEQWAWYQGAGQQPLYYVIPPNSSIRPTFNGLPIEANAIQIWGRTLTGRAVRWGNPSASVRVVEKAYRAQLGTYTYRFDP